MRAEAQEKMYSWIFRIHNVERLLIPLFWDALDLTTFSKYTPAIAEQNVIPNVATIPKNL